MRWSCYNSVTYQRLCIFQKCNQAKLLNQRNRPRVAFLSSRVMRPTNQKCKKKKRNENEKERRWKREEIKIKKNKYQNSIISSVCNLLGIKCYCMVLNIVRPVQSSVVTNIFPRCINKPKVMVTQFKLLLNCKTQIDQFRFS